MDLDAVVEHTIIRSAIHEAGCAGSEGNGVSGDPRTGDRSLFRRTGLAYRTCRSPQYRVLWPASEPIFREGRLSMTDHALPGPISSRRAELASFDHAYAVAIQRREAGETHQLVIQTGDPIQPYRVVAGEAANDGRVLARVA